MRAKRTDREVFLTRSLFGYEGIYYYNPKIVGVNFKSELVRDFSRRRIIADFVRVHGKDVILGEPDCRYEIIQLLDKDAIPARKKYMEKYLKLIPEPNNKYDSNAIAVFVDTGMVRADIGYLPKEHSRIIKENFSKFDLLGAISDGAGLRLDILLYKSKEVRDPLLSVMEPEKILPEFMSLRQIRKSFEIGD